MVFLDALGSMTSIALFVAVGFAVARSGRVTKQVETFIPWFVTRIALPPHLAEATAERIDRAAFLRDAADCLVPLLGMCVVLAVFLLLSRPAGVSQGRRGTAAAAATFSNVIFIGIPVNEALFGPESLQVLLLYLVANSTLFWTAGNLAIARDGKGGRRMGAAETARNVLSPPLLGMLVGVVLLILEIPVPAFLGKACSMLGGLGTPLALVYIGIVLSGVDRGGVSMRRDLALALAGRFLLSPAVMLLLTLVLPMDVSPTAAKILVIQAALPCVLSIAVLGGYHEADREFASAVTGLSAVVGMIAVPIWMTALSLFFPS